MNIVSKISAATLLLFSSSSCNAQIKNAKTESRENLWQLRNV
jgi:hypothetical protein